jgi:hypothetical protein
MPEMVRVVPGLESLLQSASIQGNIDDFEAVFSALASDAKRSDIVAQIERVVFDYFAVLELPDEPTLYDHLVLSLRDKDIIATFNWDPLLWQAIARNVHTGPMPHPVFLHGNVTFGYCMKHMPIAMRPRGDVCQICRRRLEESKLLFPIKEKNYKTDPFIAKSWQWIQQELNAAYLLTVFGYRAPSTDVEAVTLLEHAWDAAHSHQYKTVEIIDIRTEEELFDTWRPFVQSHYYTVINDFYSSNLGRFPRRSCETIFSGEMEIEYAKPNTIPRNADWEKLRAWFAPLIEAEQTTSVQP